MTARTMPIGGRDQAITARDVDDGMRGAPRPPVMRPQPAPARPPSTPISRFLELEIEARQCTDLDKLRFAIANAPRKLAEVDQALLFEPAHDGRLLATRAASVATIDRNAPAVRALESWLERTARHAPATLLREPQLFDLARPAEDKDPSLAVMPHRHAFWLPIKSRDGRVLAALFMLRSDPWPPQMMAMLMPLADAYGHAWAALAPRSGRSLAVLRRMVSRSRLALGSGLALVALAFVPVPMSTIAPAEIVAAEPMLVTAPLDGVVGDVLAQPGSWVQTGTPILKLVDVKLRNDVEIATRSREVAEARYFKARQTALTASKEQQDLATAQSELDLADAELRYAAELLTRSEIRAERTGLLIYAAKSDLVGKPVSVGEKLMEIADPAKAEIRVDLQVSDAITLRAGSPVSLFLDSDPLRSFEGVIIRTSYRPTLAADQQLVYRLFAAFGDSAPRRIGLRGVARIGGEPVPLWLFLFRRPITAVRQRFGV